MHRSSRGIVCALQARELADERRQGERAVAKAMADQRRALEGTRQSQSHTRALLQARCAPCSVRHSPRCTVRAAASCVAVAAGELNKLESESRATEKSMQAQLDNKDMALRKSEKERLSLIEQLEAALFKLEVAERNLGEAREAKAEVEEMLKEERRAHLDETRELKAQIIGLEEGREEALENARRKAQSELSKQSKDAMSEAQRKVRRTRAHTRCSQLPVHPASAQCTTDVAASCALLHLGRISAASRLQVEEEKEKRVQHLAQVGLKRIMNGAISRGWTAWHGMWAEKVRRKNLLKKAGARLTKPKLVAAYGRWQKDWTAAEVAKMGKTDKQLIKDLTESSARADAERRDALGQLKVAEEKLATCAGRSRTRTVPTDPRASRASRASSASSAPPNPPRPAHHRIQCTVRVLRLGYISAAGT